MMNKIKSNYGNKLLILFFAFLITGCAESFEARNSSAYSVRSALFAARLLQSTDLLPSRRRVPATSDSKAYAALINIEDASIAAVFDVNRNMVDEGFTGEQEIIDVVTSLLTQSLGAEVTYFSPEILRSFGLRDAEAVHKVVISNLLRTVDMYLRFYINFVDGPQGKQNIRVDAYMWLDADTEGLDDTAADLLTTPGQYVFGVEVERDVVTNLLASDISL